MNNTSEDEQQPLEDSQTRYDVILVGYPEGRRVAMMSTILQCRMRPDSWEYPTGPLAFILELVENVPSCVALDVDYKTAREYRGALEFERGVVEIRPADERESSKYYTGPEEVD